ncbi:MAG: HK97 gp10 family phage protein [Kiritimatiellae bacterium]|nr:HK97 gp10 family phage protein [Kiritimatiellia bacterium]
MSNVEVKGGDLADIIKEMFDDCDYAVIEATKTASKSVADQCVKKLKATSPKNRAHTKYAKSWKSKKIDDGYVVYNEKAGLTHLLENGHDVVRNGVKVGRARAIPHIKPVEEDGKKLFVEEVEKEIEKRLTQ